MNQSPKQIREELKAQRKELREQKKAAKVYAEKQLQLKRHQEKKEALVQQAKYLAFVKKRDESQMPTRAFNPADKVAVRLDARTVIYVKAGSDPEEAKRKFQERHATGKQVLSKSYNQQAS